MNQRTALIYGVHREGSMVKQALIEPRAVDDGEIASRLLAERFPGVELDWLVEELKDFPRFWAILRHEETPRLDATKALLDWAQPPAPTRVLFAAALVRFIAAAALREGDGPRGELDARTRQLSVRAAKHVSLADGVREAFKQPLGPVRAVDIPALVVASGGVSIARAVSLDAVKALAVHQGAYPKTWGGDARYELERDPSNLLFWLIHSRGAAFNAAVEILKSASDKDAPAVAKGLLWLLGCWAWSTHHHQNNFSLFGEEFQRCARALFDEVVRRREVPSLGRDPLLCEAFARLGWAAFDKRERDVGAALRTSFLNDAKRELGRLRAELRTTSADDAPAWFEKNIDHIEASAHSLFTYGSLWEGLKPLLLLVRESKTPIFAEDLSWWTRKKPQKNNAVAHLAQQLMFGFQAYARFEQNSDPELKDLRDELATFCVERVSSSKKREGPNEPSAVWRAASMRALGELGANPGGKAHQTVHFAMEKDADEDVRKAAASVYDQVKNRKGIPKDSSPRRAVLHALWWLRQAHMLELEQNVDVAGAQQTRAEEVRITTRGKEVPDEHP